MVDGTCTLSFSSFSDAQGCKCCNDYDRVRQDWNQNELILSELKLFFSETGNKLTASRVSVDCRPDLKDCAFCISRKGLIARSHDGLL
jgi:hypothetical protein